MIGLMVVMLMVFFQVWRVGISVSSLGSWSYSKEYLWNLGTKLRCNVPGSEMSCRLLMNKSWNTRGASHQPAFIGSCLTIDQTCLRCPTSR